MKEPIEIRLRLDEMGGSFPPGTGYTLTWGVYNWRNECVLGNQVMISPEVLEMSPTANIWYLFEAANRQMYEYMTKGGKNFAEYLQNEVMKTANAKGYELGEFLKLTDRLDATDPEQ